jgi:hypothetical protein
MIARATVSPPNPESKIPIGAALDCGDDTWRSLRDVRFAPKRDKNL